ncbi:peptidoglycan bridge formation glycyltransferase FemA/FemB family protein [bacterium]|nr:peptidoglycan bridge formation glycyltransferase FemA/FemB family protein [bacterium]
MKVFISTDPIIDEEWENFLRSQPTGHHVQSSAWGIFKASSGMKVLRIIVKEEDKIVGGAQILLRSLPIIGSIGYITRGPVAKDDRADILEFLFDHLETTAKEHQLLVLSIGLPTAEKPYMDQLEKRNYMPSDFYVIPPTTVLTNLEGDDSEIMSQMKSRTRRNIRKGLKSGLVVREGTEADIPLIFSWMEETAKQDHYYHYDLDYYYKALEILKANNILELFVADYDGEPISAIFVGVLGDWSVFKWGASSGEHLETRPNELLHWHAMQWSKEFGCKYYDMGGITPDVAEALNNGEDLPDSKGSGIAHFKLGFGEKFIFPDAYDNNYTFLPRWFVRWVVKHIWDNEFLRRVTRKVLNPGS